MLWKGFQKPNDWRRTPKSLTDRYGMSGQPFERGFGTTIGNALAVYSCLRLSAAVTAVKIEGVLHEFQSIQGVVEDATDIILNLKQIPSSERERSKGYLRCVPNNQAVSPQARSRPTPTLKCWTKIFTSPP